MRIKGDKERARTLRRSMTLPEVLLWRQLRNKPGGIQFRRQHPAGPYVIDFFCATANVAVEVDGEAHNRGNRPKRDAVRDAWLKNHGIRVLHIPATGVLKNLDGVLQFISVAASAR